MRSKKLQIGRGWFCVVRTGQPRIFNHPKSLPYTIQSNLDTKIICLSINQSGWRSHPDKKNQAKGSKQEGCLPVLSSKFSQNPLKMMNFRKLELPWGSNNQWIRASQSIGILTRMAHPDRLRVVSWIRTTTPTPKKRNYGRLMVPKSADHLGPWTFPNHQQHRPPEMFLGS